MFFYGSNKILSRKQGKPLPITVANTTWNIHKAQYFSWSFLNVIEISTLPKGQRGGFLVGPPAGGASSSCHSTWATVLLAFGYPVGAGTLSDRALGDNQKPCFTWRHLKHPQVPPAPCQTLSFSKLWWKGQCPSPRRQQSLGLGLRIYLLIF